MTVQAAIKRWGVVCMKKCDMIGCSNPGIKMYHLAPGTTVWLCGPCIEARENEKAS